MKIEHFEAAKALYDRGLKYRELLERLRPVYKALDLVSEGGKSTVTLQFGTDVKITLTGRQQGEELITEQELAGMLAGIISEFQDRLFARKQELAEEFKRVGEKAEVKAKESSPGTDRNLAQGQYREAKERKSSQSKQREKA